MAIRNVENILLNPSILLSLFGLLFLSLIFGCVFCWIFFIAAKVNKIPLPMIEIQPRKAAPWGFLDIVLLVFLVLAAQVAAVAISLFFGIATIDDFGSDEKQAKEQASSLAMVSGLVAQPPPVLQPEPLVEDTAESQGITPTEGIAKEGKSSDSELPSMGQMMASAICQGLYLLVMLVVTLFIMARYAAQREDVGWSLRKIGSDLLLGLVATAMFLPLIFVLMFVVSNLFKEEYHHPIIDMAQKEPSFIWIAIWMAVITAPIAEEFAFRVILQGFLESIASRPFNMVRFLLGETTFAEPLSAPKSTLEPPLPEERNPRVPIWPMFVVGILFGLAHFDYGLSFIPLSILGILMGALYRLTHRIWPCFVVHFALNSFSMFSLYLTIHAPK